MPDPSNKIAKADIENVLREAGLRFRSIGDGEIVTGQLPEAGLHIAKDTETILYFGAEASKEKETVPNLVGMSYNDARDLLSDLGLYIHTVSPVREGESRVVCSQSLRPGTEAGHGSVIEVSLTYGDDSLLGRY